MPGTANSFQTTPDDESGIFFLTNQFEKNTLIRNMEISFIFGTNPAMIHMRMNLFVLYRDSNKWIIMLIIIAILLVLGCFLEGIAVLVITIPVFIPLITQFGVDPIQFGVIMVLCSMLGLLTPPVGMSLYAVSSISDVPIGSLSKELWPYLLGIFVVLILIAYVPVLSLGIPDFLMPH